MRFSSLQYANLSFLLCGRTAEACRMVKSLRKDDFTSYWPLFMEMFCSRPPPLEKIIVARPPIPALLADMYRDGDVMTRIVCKDRLGWTLPNIGAPLQLVHT